MKLDFARVVLGAASVASAQVLPSPIGPYHVAWENKELVDESRLDPFNSSHVRRMMISRFTPVPRSDCAKICNVPYFTPEMNRIQDEILGSSTRYDWPPGVFANLEVEVCCKTKPQSTKKHFPKILYGTGLNTTRGFYTGAAQQIASMGYELIVMDHPYDTDAVQFPNGDIIYGGRITLDNNIVFGLDVRKQDISFVLDTFDIDKTTIIGQSYGGAAAAHALLTEPRLVAGVNLDGALWGDVQYSGVDRPFLSFGNPTHNSNSLDEPSWGNFFNAMEAKHPDVWNKEFSIKGSTHQAYYDFSLIGDVTGMRNQTDLVEGLFGTNLGVRMYKILGDYLSDFIQFTLLGGDEGLLSGDGEHPEYPEVVFVRET